jgi:hypothetical protein
VSDPEKKLDGATGVKLRIDGKRVIKAAEITSNTADSEDYDCGIVYLSPLERFRLELVEKAENIRLRCKLGEMVEIVEELPARTEQEVRKLRSQAASHAGRHSRKPRSPFMARVLPSMAQCKRGGGELKRDFIPSWENNPIGGLKLKTTRDGFVIEDENATGDEPGSETCQLRTLVDWWRVCSKEPPVTG